MVGGLIGLGIPEDEAKRYDEYVRNDKLLVMVDVADDRQSRVYDIFRTHGSLNSDMYGTMDSNAVHSRSGRDHLDSDRTIL